MHGDEPADLGLDLGDFAGFFEVLDFLQVPGSNGLNGLAHRRHEGLLVEGDRLLPAQRLDLYSGSFAETLVLRGLGGGLCLGGLHPGGGCFFSREAIVPIFPMTALNFGSSSGALGSGFAGGSAHGAAGARCNTATTRATWPLPYMR